MPYLINKWRPTDVASAFDTRAKFLKEDHELLFSQACETVDEAATVVVQIVLDPVPANRDPLATACAHRVLSWNGEGELLFPMAPMVTVAVVQATYPDMALICQMTEREARVLEDAEGALMDEYNLRMGASLRRGRLAGPAT